MMIAEMVYVHGAVCVQMQPNLFDVVGSCVLMLGHPFQFDSRSSMHIRGLTKQTHITGTSCQSIRSTQAKGSEGVRVQFGFDLFSYAYGIGWAIHCQSDVWPWLESLTNFCIFTVQPRLASTVVVVIIVVVVTMHFFSWFFSLSAPWSTSVCPIPIEYLPIVLRFTRAVYGVSYGRIESAIKICTVSVQCIWSVFCSHAEQLLHISCNIHTLHDTCSTHSGDLK